MNNILIFRTDKFGDLLNSSSVIYNLKKNFPNSNIDFVCSEYNHYLSKFYKKYLNNIIVYNKPFFLFLFKNRNILKKKYDLLLVLDGKKHSFLSSIFINSKIRASLKYIKKKKILNFNYNIQRPGFFIKKFYNYFYPVIEDYSINNNKKYHYLTLYLTMLKDLSLKIFKTDYFLPINSKFKKKIIGFNNYYLIHVDSRWANYDQFIIIKFKKRIIELSKKNKIVITSDKSNFFIKDFDKKIKNKNIHLCFDTNINDIISLVYNSKKIVSSHSGLIVTLAACFKKPIIDIIPKYSFNAYDRWIPLNYNYKRYDLKNISQLKL